MNQLRRTFLKGTGAAGTVAVAIAAGLLKPGQVLAAEWNKNAFEAKNTADAMKGIGAAGAAKSADIMIKAPDIAENGAVVPVEVTSKIPGTTRRAGAAPRGAGSGRPPAFAAESESARASPVTQGRSLHQNRPPVSDEPDSRSTYAVRRGAGQPMGACTGSVSCRERRAAITGQPAKSLQVWLIGRAALPRLGREGPKPGTDLAGNGSLRDAVLHVGHPLRAREHHRVL